MNLPEADFSDFVTYCCACLSNDRTLTNLDRYAEIFIKLFDTEFKNLHKKLICWECKAKLKNIKQFTEQVVNAQKNLKESISRKKPLQSLSRLATFTPNEILYQHEVEPKDVTNETCNIKVKIEVEDILKEEISSDQEITYDECIDDIPVDDSFKTKIKKEQESIRKKKSIKRKKVKHETKNDCSDYLRPIETKIEGRIEEWMQKERDSPYFKSFNFKCEDCLKGFSTKHGLTYHRNTRHNPENDFKCSICHMTFRKRGPHQLHVSSHHRRLLECRKCGFRCIGMVVMRWHLEDHVEGSVQCDYCVATFENIAQERRHFIRFHKELACDACGHTEVSKRKMATHILNAHGPRTCEICNKTFKNYRIQREHTLTLHTVKHDENSYCVTCDIQFDNEKLFKRHLINSVKHLKERKGDEPKKTYPCPVCGKEYKQRYGMRNHYRFVHLKSTNYYCEQCDLYVLNRTMFLRHMNKHKGIKLEKNKFCDICGRGFHTNRILINHIRTHTGERPHHCPHCDAKFAQITAMKTHVKHIHLKMERRRHFLT